MTTNDQTIEAQIQAKGKTAARVTPAAIEANIFSEHYFTAGDALKAIDSEEYKLWVDEAPSGKALNQLTFCVLVLKNGFFVTGESACVSPENFDAETGKRVARKNAVQKIGPLMGYELRSKLAADQKAA